MTDQPTHRCKASRWERPMTATKRKKVKPVEAWATVSPDGRLYTLHDDMDDAVAEVSDNPLMREYRVVALTSAPEPKPDQAEVKRLKAVARAAKALQWHLCPTNIPVSFMARWRALDAALQALKPRRTTKPRRK